MSEPTTAAGRALLDCIPYVTVDWSMDEWRDEVRAIEAEADALSGLGVPKGPDRGA